MSPAKQCTSTETTKEAVSVQTGTTQNLFPREIHTNLTLKLGDNAVSTESKNNLKINFQLI